VREIGRVNRVAVLSRDKTDYHVEGGVNWDVILTTRNVVGIMVTARLAKR